jgi:hypothetical protein
MTAAATKRKKAKRGARRKVASAVPPRAHEAQPGEVVPPSDEQIAYSGLSLHDLFQQQTRDMLDRTEMDEEQKQTILLAMSCPCCGAGGLSFTAKLSQKPTKRSR